MVGRQEEQLRTIATLRTEIGGLLDFWSMTEQLKLDNMFSSTTATTTQT
jgi:hypothetical protein